MVMTPKLASSGDVFHFPGKEVNGKERGALKGMGSGIQQPWIWWHRKCVTEPLYFLDSYYEFGCNRIVVRSQWKDACNTPDKVPRTQEAQSMTVTIKEKTLPPPFPDFCELNM